MKKSQVFLILLIVALLTFVVIILVMMNTGAIPTIFKSKNYVAKMNVRQKTDLKDDWCYVPTNYLDDFGINSTLPSGINSMVADSAMAGVSQAESSNLGYSVGGAKDINNFRENIEKGYFPLETDITYEGIYYDYAFDTGNNDKQSQDKMFYPTYSTAISKDPISEEPEYYVSVGLNSNIKEEDFTRKNLNLMLVLDISGSMSSSMDNYYYDMNENDDEEFKSKMKVAEESINILLDKLGPNDSVGMVLFDGSGYLAKPLNLVGETDMEAIKEHILEVEAMGGTNFEAGINYANDAFEEYGIKDKNEYENRMIILTDAMPNIGETSKDGLRKILENNSEKGIYTTFIGVGLDFNSEVVKNITDIKGANYYSVSNEEEFRTRMGEEFEYMVTPLVFDLNMNLEAEGFEVVKVYGTDSYSSEDGNIMHVNTLFPSKSNSDGEVKGGIIVLKLKKTKEDANSLKLVVSYETRDGQKDESSENVEFYGTDEYYDNTGIRKGILLARYVNLIKNWTEFERSKDDRFLVKVNTGIFDFVTSENENDMEYFYYYSENERTSVKLTVSDEYKEIFNKFKAYMESEIKELGDGTLNQEIQILEKILEA